MFCILLAPTHSLEVQYNLGFSLLNYKLLIWQLLEMDASASDFSAHNTYCKHCPHALTHRAVRQCLTSCTCIILSSYNTFVPGGLTFVVIIMEQKGKNHCDNEIKRSALPLCNLFYSTSQNVKEGYVKNVFKLKALVLHSELFQQWLRDSHCLLQKEKLLFLPNLLFPLNNFCNHYREECAGAGS